jgi:hypothetical protein
MKTRITILFFALVLIAQMSLVTSARAEGRTECAQDVAHKYFLTQKNFQSGMRDLLLANWPELQELATLNRDLQTALAELRKLKLIYLLEHEPDKVVTSGGLSKFSNFDWSDEDQAKFVQASEAHAQLAEKVETLKTANNAHPDWEKLRANFRSPEMANSLELKNLMSRFSAGVSKLGKLLGKCPEK